MDKIREVAFFCIGRAVMFGVLAITCVMVGFSFNPVSALRSGAVMTLGMAAILSWQAFAAQRKSPRKTEVWLYLDERTRPSSPHADYAFATIMRDVYGRFARISLAVACGFYLLSVVLTLFGLEPFTPESFNRAPPPAS